MRAALDELVAAQLSRSAAIPAFTCYSADTALSVVDAAAALKLPMSLLVPPSLAAAGRGPQLIKTLRHIADDAIVPVCLQLDHANDVAIIRDAVEAGVDAVLADGSHLSPEHNAEFVRRVRSLTEPGRVVVEAELGSVPGIEDRATAQALNMAGKTDPDTVRAFVEASGAQLLACSVGNVHGHYRGTPEIDWPLLARIRENLDGIPLVLHGASGIPNTDLKSAATAGIGKVNVNTELRSAILQATEENLGRCRESCEDMLSLTDETTAAAADRTSAARGHMWP